MYIGDINNTIGGSASGDRNIISGNAIYGLYIAGASATGNLIKGNYIGLSSDGLNFISSSSQDYGIYITSSANSNTIGGTAAGEGNVISGNFMGASGFPDGYGIYTDASGNIIKGNIIGPQFNGTTALGNTATQKGQKYGVYVNSSPNNIIGGSASSNERNIISGNDMAGIWITGALSTGNVMKNNYIGLASNGTSILSGMVEWETTQDYGINISATASSNTIGGTAANEGNVISGNGDQYDLGFGIQLDGNSNTIQGNIIGPQANGTAVLTSAEQYYGILLTGNNNIIGNTRTAGVNVITGNNDRGIWGYGTYTSNIIKGNFIGIASNGTALLSGGEELRQ